MRTRGRVNTVKQPTGTTGLTGDVVTMPGGGVQEAIIPANTVTYAQLQDISAASRLLGRGSDHGAGDPEEISLGDGLELVDTELRATGAVFAFDPDLKCFTTPR